VPDFHGDVAKKKKKYPNPNPKKIQKKADPKEKLSYIMVVPAFTT
jgi:hypothetical protein